MQNARRTYTEGHREGTEGHRVEKRQKTKVKRQKLAENSPLGVPIAIGIRVKKMEQEAIQELIQMTEVHRVIVLV